jgi:C-8 sterol isomerase
MFNNAGGAMGSMLVLHCSMSEYIIIFGTAVGTEGHTGRFLAEDYFTILYGEQVGDSVGSFRVTNTWQWAFPAGAIEKEVYAAGDQHFLPQGQAKQYRMPEACWALEYARGNIPSMMPFGLFDTFFSTLDFVSLYQTIKVSAAGMLTQLLRGKI